MRYILIYWIIGSFVCGMGLAESQQKCPEIEIDKLVFLIAVATWPAAIGYSIVGSPVVKACLSKISTTP